MGNHRFRLSDMLPNAWFYKLRDMSSRARHHRKLPAAPASTSSHHKHSTFSYQSTPEPARSTPFYNSPVNPKASDTRFPDPPRKSSKRRTIYHPSPTHVPYTPSSSSSISTRADVDIDTNKKFLSASEEEEDGLDAAFEVELPQILTRRSSKPRKPTNTVKAPPEMEEMKFHQRINARREAKESCLVEKHATNYTGVKLRRRFGGRRAPGSGRRSASTSKKRSFLESFAVEKASFDPQRDFKDSMEEMIVENDIRSSKDLEELLACYLSLNSDEYHNLIIKAFQQIWSGMSEFHRI